MALLYRDLPLCKSYVVFLLVYDILDVAFRHCGSKMRRIQLKEGNKNHFVDYLKMHIIDVTVVI